VASLSNPPAGCDFAGRCAYARPLCRERERPNLTQADGRVHACLFPLR